MKVLFLDMDGVMNTYGVYTAMSTWPDGHIFDEHIVELNRVLEKTGAHIVLSSSWRCHMEIEELQHAFDRKGIKGRIIDKTPDFITGLRGEEIKSWLNDEERVSNITSFAIVDDVDVIWDNLELGYLAKHFVKTNPFTGLTKQCADQLIEILNKR